MCTALTYKTDNFYFGRTLDNDFSYREEVTVTPRNYEFKFRNGYTLNNHFSIIGMAFVYENYPLYYDAFNEKGLCIAGLNFVGNAVYSNKSVSGKDNIAVFELIPWILGQCGSVSEVRDKLKKINITDIPFSSDLPTAQLHWLVADRDQAITVEAVEEGLKVYDNPVGVLTNNPSFPEQLFRLNDYMHLSPDNPKNLFSEKIKLNMYSRGMGAMGLPGDLSSSSRFVRAAFTKLNSRSGSQENESVSQFFNILQTVQQTRGCCHLGDGKYEITLYTSCCDTDKGIYYYTTYNNHRISAVDMFRENLESKFLIRYALTDREQFCLMN